MLVLVIGGDSDRLLDDVCGVLRRAGFIPMLAVGCDHAVLFDGSTEINLALIIGGRALTERMVDALGDRGIPTVVVASSDLRRMLDRLRSESVLLPADASAWEIASACSAIMGRRVRLDEPPTVEFGPLTVDLEHESVSIGGEAVALAPKEFLLLKELILANGRPLPSHELMRRVWPDDSVVTPGDVHRHIYRLRARIGDQEREDALIVNRRGYGYAVNVESRALRA